MHDHLVAKLHAWGNCQLITSFAGGHRNEVVLVQRGDERLVAKSSRRSSAAIVWLEDVQAKAREAGFVVPHFVPSNTGELLVEGVTVETWIDGKPLAGADLARVQPLVREFHRLTGEWPQRPGFTSSLDLLVEQRSGDVDLSVMPAEIVAACRAAWQELTDEALSVVHGDLSPSNLLVTPEGRVALLDWDETRVDVSLFDEAALPADEEGPGRIRVQRALLAWEVAVSWQVEPEYARRLAGELLSGWAHGWN